MPVMIGYNYQPATQCIYNVTTASSRIEKLNRMHVHCISKMEQALVANDQIKFWTLMAIDTRILQAKARSL